MIDSIDVNVWIFLLCLSCVNLIFDFSLIEREKQNDFIEQEVIQQLFVESPPEQEEIKSIPVEKETVSRQPSARRSAFSPVKQIVLSPSRGPFSREPQISEEVVEELKVKIEKPKLVKQKATLIVNEETKRKYHVFKDADKHDAMLNNIFKMGKYSYKGKDASIKYNILLENNIHFYLLESFLKEFNKDSLNELKNSSVYTYGCSKNLLNDNEHEELMYIKTTLGKSTSFASL